MEQLPVNLGLFSLHFHELAQRVPQAVAKENTM